MCHVDSSVHLHMDYFTIIVNTVLFLCYTLYIVMTFVLLYGIQPSLLTSNFFQTGDDFVLLGVEYSDGHLKNGLFIFFSLNSFLTTIQFSTVGSIWSKIVVNTNHSDISTGMPSFTYLFTVLTLSDIWAGFRSFFSLVGTFSNWQFFVGNMVGFVFASVIVKLVFIKYPDLMEFNTSKHSVHGTEEHLYQHVGGNTERQHLLRHKTTPGGMFKKRAVITRPKYRRPDV